MSDAITVIAPRNIEESEKLSTTLSKSALLPEALRGKPSDVLATLLAGAELGLAPMQALRGIQIIKGKPSLSADLMGALVKRNREVCEYLQLVDSTEAKATYETKRVGDPKPTTMSFTMEDAKAAGIAGDMYKKYPKNMLRARCLAAICRAVYPDLCFGLYDSDSGELGESVTSAPTPEREINPPPPAQTRTEAVKAKLRMPVVEVKAGETEQEATAREAKPDEPTVFERCCVVCVEYGIADTTRQKSIIKGSTGKTTPAQLVPDDIAKVRGALEALKAAEDRAAMQQAASPV